MGFTETFKQFERHILPLSIELIIMRSKRCMAKDNKLIIAREISDTVGYGKELKELAAGYESITFTGFVQGESWRNSTPIPTYTVFLLI